MDDEKTFTLDPPDLEGMRKLMDEYGDSETMFPGKNEDGELVFISIYHDRIIQETYQANDWIRRNTYWRDGTREETYKK